MSTVLDPEQVRTHVRKVVGETAPRPRDGIQPSDHMIADVGYHSLAAVELSVVLQETFGLPLVDAATLSKIKTVADVEALVLRLLPESTPSL